MRFIGHQTQIGLICIGNPDPNSPVLCTCNFKLTFTRLCKLLNTNQINTWLLIAPTGGVNVWCSACGGEFNAGSVIIAIKISSIEKYVNHRTIILPQLSAPRINPNKVNEITGWKCVWGPVNMNDLSDFLKGLPNSIHNKTEKQRKITFKTKFRLEMASLLIFPILLITVIPLSIILYLFNQWDMDSSNLDHDTDTWIFYFSILANFSGS
ncbi:MAG: hypothetical protein ACTSYZ_07280 [Candidatus Helarchaeota archaeon]